MAYKTAIFNAVNRIAVSEAIKNRGFALSYLDLSGSNLERWIQTTQGSISALGKKLEAITSQDSHAWSIWQQLCKHDINLIKKAGGPENFDWITFDPYYPIWDLDPKTRRVVYAAGRLNSRYN